MVFILLFSQLILAQQPKVWTKTKQPLKEIKQLRKQIIGLQILELLVMGKLRILKHLKKLSKLVVKMEGVELSFLRLYF
jgi:hypothetical protein